MNRKLKHKCGKYKICMFEKSPKVFQVAFVKQFEILINVNQCNIFSIFATSLYFSWFCWFAGNSNEL